METLADSVRHYAAPDGAQIITYRRAGHARARSYGVLSHLRVAGVVAACLFGTACSGQSETPSNQLEPGEALDVAGMYGHASGSIRVDGNSIVEGRNAFLIQFTPTDTALTQASALMPAHGHGAPATPTITRTQTGYRVSDMILSMPGLWDIMLDVDVAGAADRIEFTVDVP